MLILLAARKPVKRKANNEQEPADEVKVLALSSLSFTKGLKEVLTCDPRRVDFLAGQLLFVKVQSLHAP